MRYQLAQINIARMLAPIDSPVMADFVANLDPINALAERSEGFVWRLVDESNNATSIQVFDDEFLIVNMSVWDSIETLFQFTYHTTHREIFKRRKEWFTQLGSMHMACWYIPEGHIPSPAEAKERLAYLDQHGQSPLAFTFKQRFSVEAMLDFEPT